MKVTPIKVSTAVGAEVQILCSDFVDDVEFTSGVNITVSDNEIITATTTESDPVGKTITITCTVGEKTGKAIVTITTIAGESEEWTPSIGVSVITVVESLKELTQDGSGTDEDDTYLFGRQYIINQNLIAVDSLVADVQQVCNQIKVLTIANNIATAAAIAEVAVLCGNILSKVKALKRSPIVVH